MLYKVYQSKSVLNVHQHVDGGWFWDKYTAFPYLGCQWGCHYCYARDEKYNPHKADKDSQVLQFKDPFSQYIKIKKDAPNLLKKALKSKPKDVIYLDNYQPIEAKYRYVRKMLQVCLDLKFPVFINEKSPLLLDDLGLLKKINKTSYLNVGWSIITAKDDQVRKVFEPKAPLVSARFKAMKKLAKAGILTGTILMPILPFIYDTEENIEAVVKKTKECGGQYVLDGGLTLWGYCGKHFYKILADYDSKLVSKYKEIYKSQTAKAYYYDKVHQKVLNFCKKYQLKSFIPRPIAFYPKSLQINKKIAESFYLKARQLQLSGNGGFREWAYRKAAWSMDELDQNIKMVYKEKGLKGLEEIKGIGKSMAKQIKIFLQNISI